ncbi:HAMP domain-containing histidine kinase [Cyanobacterium stanieri LEGE 03274]|uniref:histidine kinase n=1 Tax=Cyanobacterium stanieri LEGE 03274 TaxID=1828756 RepID=A0ABR9V495_9CHRO|nr:HAMP domain-containing sensor histidine kinase [Cyanobacterium stanieri]MBE9222667.1 HAMP domain-containing histidine kinase [Cyanobacterium stanieri LEGE 03274]
MNENTSLAQELKEAKIAFQNASLYARFQAGFLGRVSHEIRSPLGSLMSIHQLILNDLCESEEEEREFIAQAYEYSKKLMNMLDELIEISKLEAGRFELELVPLKCLDFLKFVQEKMKMQGANRNVILDVAMVDESLMIMADREKLAQGFFYWLEVAIDVSQLGTITLGADSQAPDNYSRLTINLPFSSEEFKESSQFEELSFHQTKGLESCPTLSDGAKISLAQSLIHLMGGQCRLQEITDKTTCLEIFLPNSGNFA